MTATTYYTRSGKSGVALGYVGADVDNGNAGNDADDGTTSQPWLDYLNIQFGMLVDGDILDAGGRFRTDDATQAAMTLTDGTTAAATIGQWSGQPQAQIRNDNLAGNTGWTSSGNGYFKTLTTQLSIITATWDYEAAANIHGVRRWAHLRPPTVNGVRAMGAWSAVTSYVVGDSVISAGTTYIAITANLNDVPPSANWQTYATQKTAALAAGGTADGKWAYNPDTGEFAIGIPSGQTATFNAGTFTPAADGCAYSTRARHGLALIATVEGTQYAYNIQNTRFALFSDASSASPLGADTVFQNSVGSIVTGCTGEDCGLHFTSFGGRCTNNTTSYNTVIGMGQGSIAFVFNATGTTGGVRNHTSACVSISDTVYANSLLTHSGKLANRNNPVGAFIAHGGGGSEVRDVSIVDPQVIEYTPSSGSPDQCTQFTIDDCATVAAANQTTPSAYPFRVTQTVASNKIISNGSFWPDQGTTTYASFVSGRFNFAQFGSLSNGTAIDLTSLTGVILFVGCEFIFNFAPNAAGHATEAMFRIGAAGSVILVNCSCYDYSAGPGAGKVYAVVRFGTAGGFFKAYGCIFAFANAGAGTVRFCTGDGAAGFNNGAQLVVQDCAVYGVADGNMSQNTTIDAQAEWTSLVDPRAVFLPANPFADTTGLTDLSLTSAAKSLKQRNPIHAAKGSNQVNYGNNFGSVQSGSGGGRIKRMRRLNRLSRV